MGPCNVADSGCQTTKHRSTGTLANHKQLQSIAAPADGQIKIAEE